MVKLYDYLKFYFHDDSNLVEDLGDYSEMIIDGAHICTQLVSLLTLKQIVHSWWTSHQEFPMVLSS
jgi:hypothetical protein